MMTLRLTHITALGPDRYELTLETQDGHSERVTCRVFDHHGTTGVRYEPDPFVTGRANAREVTAAVLARHRDRVKGADS
jgi:hypothetical protein